MGGKKEERKKKKMKRARAVQFIVPQTLLAGA